MLMDISCATIIEMPGRRVPELIWLPLDSLATKSPDLLSRVTQFYCRFPLSRLNRDFTHLLRSNIEMTSYILSLFSSSTSLYAKYTFLYSVQIRCRMSYAVELAGYNGIVTRLWPAGTGNVMLLPAQ